MSNWVNIADKLPKEGERVLMYEHGSINVASYYRPVTMSHQPTEKLWFYNQYGECCGTTHWMYLPGPPTDDERTPYEFVIGQNVVENRFSCKGVVKDRFYCENRKQNVYGVEYSYDVGGLDWLVESRLTADDP